MKLLLLLIALSLVGCSQEKEWQVENMLNEIEIEQGIDEMTNEILEYGSSPIYFEEEIIWIGYPMTSDNNAYSPSKGWLPNYQTGFRDDGVVVWRKVNKEQNE